MRAAPPPAPPGRGGVWRADRERHRSNGPDYGAPAFRGRGGWYRAASLSPLLMRALPLALLAALAVAPAVAQDAPAEAPQPDPQAVYVVPSGPGEAVRVTTYARRPAEPGRLARRYKGLRANRTAPAPRPVGRAVPVDRVRHAPRGAFVQRYGTFFQVVPAH